MNTAAPTVTACIPYYRGQRYIRRAVESLLGQTHYDLQVVVVNDGDQDAPWEPLAGIDDPRLIRFDLSRNHGGPFFANAVVVNAVASPWFLVQEQDDWSEPGRVERLMALGAMTGADVAVSAQNHYREGPGGGTTPVGIRWRFFGRAVCPQCGPQRRRCQRCFIDTQLTPKCLHRAPHTALFRVSTLRRIGGYYAGLRIHHDTLIMNLLLMVAKIAHTPAALYNRLLQPQSLTHAASTRTGSSAPSKHEHEVIERLYSQALRAYEGYRHGLISSDALVGSIRERCNANVQPADRRDLTFEEARLRERLGAARQYGTANARR